MKLRELIFFLSVFNSVYLISYPNLISYVDNKKPAKFNAVFRIDSLYQNYPLIIRNNQVEFSPIKGGKEESFRITETGLFLNSYYIASKPFNKRIGVDDKNSLVLYDIDDIKNQEKTIWIFIEISENNYIIQNFHNKKCLDIDSKKETQLIKKKKVIVTIFFPKCIADLSLNRLSSIGNKYKYSFFKLCEEVTIKPEHIPIIEKEPVDVLIKYIDLTDKTLNRNGINQIKKDEDNGEIKYCVRSILQYIPWVRKIFILMPNEKVKYFKPINEISDKFVYVKDKDLLGFDSENSVVFQLNLYKMEKFGLSENFILMDDDYFFGKPIKKTQFFYYDEIQKKVVPSIVTDDFTEMVKKDIDDEYNKLYRRIRVIRPHTFNGWKISQLSSFKLLLENFKSPLINAGFSHNAIPLNLKDMKEVYDLVKNKYANANKLLTEKERSNIDLQPQSLFNSFMINAKKRKVNSIPSIYYDLGSLDNKNFNIEMFVINTSGDRKYTQKQYEKARQILEKRFGTPTPYEIEIDKTNNNNNNNNNNDNKNNKNNNNNKSTSNKNNPNKKSNNEYNLEDITNSYKNLEKEYKKITNERNILNNYLKYEITKIMKEIKDMDYRLKNNTYKSKELQNFNFYKNSFKITLALLIIVIISILFYCCYYYSNSIDINENTNEKMIQMSEITDKQDNTFSKLANDELM